MSDHETLADAHDVETIWTGRTSSQTAHLDRDCPYLQNAPKEPQPRPADSIPLGYYHECSHCVDGEPWPPCKSE